MLSDQIQTRLDEYWLHRIGNMAVATPSKGQWTAWFHDFPEYLGGRFGWCFPVENSDARHPNATLLVAYCPELLAETTAHLSDEDRDDYLDAIEYLCSMFITLEDEHPDPEERVHACYAALSESAIGSLELIYAVEGHAVDVGLVPAGEGAGGTDDFGAEVWPCESCSWCNDIDVDECVICGSRRLV